MLKKRRIFKEAIGTAKSYCTKNTPLEIAKKIQSLMNQALEKKM